MKKLLSKLYPIRLGAAASSAYTLHPLRGFSALAVLTVLGLVLATVLALVGTGVIKLPNDTKLAVSPIPVSDPVEDDEACNDPYNADCETINHDPEDLTPAQIQKALEQN